MVAVAGDGVKQFVIGVFTQVSKRWEVGWHETTKPRRSLWRMNASSRWRSDVLANPHQALEAYINLAMTTDR